MKIDLMVSSPLSRTMETAQIIAQEIGFDPAKIVLDERIAEYDVGSFKGKSKKGVTSLQLTAAPGAEDPQRFQERVEACVKELARLPGNLLLVSHNGVGRMLEIIRTNGDPKLFYDGQEHGNAVVKALDWLDR